MFGGKAAGSFSSAVVSETQVKLLERKTAQCQKFIKLKLQSAKVPNLPRAVVEDLLQVMQGNLKELATHNAVKLEHYQ